MMAKMMFMVVGLGAKAAEEKISTSWDPTEISLASIECAGTMVGVHVAAN